jgi:hypothetical protein
MRFAWVQWWCDRGGQMPFLILHFGSVVGRQYQRVAFGQRRD